MTLRKKTSCLILAAGLSRRLGFDKASIMLNGAPLVSHMAEMMEKQGLETCVVVNSDFDRGVFQNRTTMTAVNPDPDSGRTGSIKIGLAALGDVSRLIIAPVDRPGFSSDTLSKLMSLNYSSCPEKDGRGGHPILLDKVGITAIRESPPDVPLRNLVTVTRFVVDDPHLHLNLDTIEDVEDLLSAWERISKSWDVNSKSK